MRQWISIIPVALLTAAAGCGEAPAPEPETAVVEETIQTAAKGPDRAALRDRARSVFGIQF